MIIDAHIVKCIKPGSGLTVANFTMYVFIVLMMTFLSWNTVGRKHTLPQRQARTATSTVLRCTVCACTCACVCVHVRVRMPWGCRARDSAWRRGPHRVCTPCTPRPLGWPRSSPAEGQSKGLPRQTRTTPTSHYDSY